MRTKVTGIVLLALSSLSCTDGNQRQSEAKNAALSKQIDGWVDTFLSLSDGANLGPMFEEAEAVYQREGIPSLAKVGDASAYGFVFINTLGLPPKSRPEFLTKLREAVALHEQPEDALFFAEAKIRQTEIEERLQDHAPSDPALRDEILRLFKTDQAVRQKEGFDVKKTESTDRQLAAPLKTILERHGVPTYDAVGVEPGKDFVLMLQHQSPEFRRAELPKLKANVESGQGDPGLYAMAYDLTQRDEGKKQLYGERFECVGEALREAPLEDESLVNIRRAKFGLMRVEFQQRLVQNGNAVPCGAASQATRNPKR
jgi:hypothetical protein